MNDQMLSPFNICLITSVAGMILLSISSESIDPPMIGPSNISPLLIDQAVSVRGEITDIHIFNGGSALVKITDNKSFVDVYIPSDLFEKINDEIAKGIDIQVIGVVSLYKGRLEVVVSKAGGVRVV